MRLTFASGQLANQVVRHTKIEHCLIMNLFLSCCFRFYLLFISFSISTNNS